MLDEPAGPATTGSLIVVAVAAAVGAGSLAAHGHVCWRIAAGFALPGAAGALAGTAASTAAGTALLVVLFVPVMLVASVATWQRAGAGRDLEEGECPDAPLGQLAPAGAAVGLLTGLFGVGGGFLIVPALALWFGVGFRRAVATSLVIITFTGLVALASHLVAGSEIDPGVTVAVALPTALGAFAGTRLSRRLPAAALGRAFAVVVCIVALLMLVDVLVLGGPPAA